MRQIRTLIVDDEPLARERLRQLLKKDPDFEIVGESGNGNDAIAAVRKLHPDLMFLDVQMPQMDGFGVLRQIDLNQMPSVIFVTAYDQYALKAFDVHAVDYLLKPFKRKRFEEALLRFKLEFSGKQGGNLAERTLALLESLNHPRSYLNRLVIPMGESSLLMKVDEVDWFQSEDNYVRVHHGPKSYLLRESLTNLESQLDPRKFLRIHRTAIVNLDQIQELQSLFRGAGRVLLRNGTAIPISRRSKQRISSILKKPGP